VQPSTDRQLEVQVPVLLKVGRLGLTEIGTVSMPSDDPVGDLAGLLRAAADHMEQA
jgi:hypothetical protein